MAARGQPTQEDDVHDPEVPGVPANEADAADPMVMDKQVPDGLSTMSGLFGKAVTVDEVVEQPFEIPQEVAEWWVVRPGTNIEDMTIGETNNHFGFKAGTRYRVPLRVAQILYNRDHLIEVPYPYEEQRRR